MYPKRLIVTIIIFETLGTV